MKLSTFSVILTKLLSAVFLGWIVTGCSGKTGESTLNNKVFTIYYLCDDGQEVVAEYDNSDPENGRVSVQLTPENPEKIEMTITRSASGARYSNGELVWWTKGKTALLTTEEADGEVLIDNCSEFIETHNQ